MAFIDNDLGMPAWGTRYHFMTVKKNERFKFRDVHRRSDFFYGQVLSTNKIDRMIKDSLHSMLPVGINPRVGEAVICQNFYGEEIDHKWYRAQIVSKWGDMYRVIFVDYGYAAEYQKDVFERHARYPTIELIRKPITCIPFKDNNSYKEIGMKLILSDLLQKYKRQIWFRLQHDYEKQVFNHKTVYQGSIYLRIGGRKVP